MSRTRLLTAGVATVLALGALGGVTGVAAGVLPPPGMSAASGTGMSGTRGSEAMMGALGMRGSADAMFAVQMVPHHESAVEMSRLAMERAERSEVRTLAADIIRTQRAEIEQLRSAAQRLGAGTDNPGMGTGMEMGSIDLAQVAQGQAFDRTFLEAMIPHHQMGVHMAQMVQRHGSDPEIHALAPSMVTAQTAEIDLMQGWLQE
jgi:uncharacterized protein (DUF305 family)